MIEEFLNYLKFELNRSNLTVAGYGDDLRTFEAFFKNLDIHLSWESIDSDIIRDWMESMMDKGNSASSINRRLSAVRSFYRFALSRKMITSDPSHSIQGPKKSRPLPQFLKESEMNEILDPKMWMMDDYSDWCLVFLRSSNIFFVESERKRGTSFFPSMEDSQSVLSSECVDFLFFSFLFFFLFVCYR